MKVESVVRLPEGAVKFSGELSVEETNLVVELGLNYLIRAGAFPAITMALQEANKAEEDAIGYSDDSSEYAESLDETQEYSFPDEMKKND